MRFEQIKEKLIARKSHVAWAAFLTAATITTTVFAMAPKNIDVRINNGEYVTYQTGKSDIHEALTDLGLLHDGDIIVGPETVINGEDYQVKTKKTLRLKTDAGEITVLSNEVTVREALDKHQIAYDEDDIISPSIENNVLDGDIIEVKTLDKEIITEDKEIPFEKEVKYDFNQEVSFKKIEQAGAFGLERTYFEVTKISGEEVDKKEVYIDIPKQPVKEITILGSKEVTKEEIPFEVEEKANDSMYKGQTKVIQEGSVGVKEYIHKVEGDKKELVSEKVTTNPVNKIVEYGTKAEVINNYDNTALKTNGSPYFGSDGLLVMKSSDRAQDVINLLMAIPGHKNGSWHHSAWGIDNLINQLSAPEAVWVIRRIEGAGFGQTGDGMAGVDSPATHANFLERQVNRRFGGSIHALLRSWATYQYSGY